MRQVVRTLAAAGTAALLLAAGCPLQTVQIVKPRNASLHDDPGLAIEVRSGRNFVHTSTVVLVDGVDLIDALGLTPPFSGAGGNVTIGGDVVAVSAFTYSIPAAPAAIQVTATLTGLSIGDHTLEAEATPSGGGGPTQKSSQFAVVGDFALAADVIASSGTPAPGVISGGNSARSVTLGDSLAAPPVGISGGGEIRQGFVPAAQGRAGIY